MNTNEATLAMIEALDLDYIRRWCDQHGTRELLEQIRAEIPPLDEVEEK